MGPAALSSAPQGGSGTATQAPQFVTNKTPKARYRDAIRMWVQMVFMFSEVDTKSKAILKGAGHLIYMACDDCAQQMLRSAEKTGSLTLKGDVNDPTREMLVEDIINVIAKDSPTEIVRMEVDLLTDIHTCVRNRKESPHNFANRFNGKVAMYVNQTTKLTDITSRQFAITLLRNASLNTTTLNALMFQLTAKAGEANKGVKLINHCINTDQCGLLTTFIDKENKEGSTNYEAIKVISTQMKGLVAKSESDHVITMFTIEDATEYLAQIKEMSDEHDEAQTKSAMLGKRIMEQDPGTRTERIKRMKEDSLCKGCGKSGHWYKDNPDCLEKVRTKQKMRYKEWNRADNGAHRSGEHRPKATSFFSTRGSVSLRADINPILDEGAPTSTGGIINASQICDFLCIPLTLRPPRTDYHHGWGLDCSGAKPIKHTWDLTINDINGKPTLISFDLVNGRSPLLVGLDIKRYADTLNRTTPSTLVFKRPEDTTERKFHTYIAPDDDGNERIRVEITPHAQSTSSSLMGSQTTRQELNMVKRVHRFSHATSREMQEMFRDAKMNSRKISTACDTVHKACDICASTGRPKDKKKVSLTHVNEAFNAEIQADYVIVYIKEEKYEVLNIIDLGTRYGERAIATTRSAENMTNMLETEWLYHHGAPDKFSADPEFCKPFMERFLNAHSIELRPRPSRSSAKNGRIERNNGTFKLILSRLSKEHSISSPHTLVARASFLTNMFHGNATLSSFQLARGYSPSILGMPSNDVSQELLDAHIESVAIRAIQKVLRSKVPNVPPYTSFKAGMRVWVFYKTSKQNERPRWVEARVVEAQEHILKCRRHKKGLPMRIAYEHVRIAPEGNLTRELMEKSLEDELASIIVDDDSTAHDDNRTDNLEAQTDSEDRNDVILSEERDENEAQGKQYRMHKTQTDSKDRNDVILSEERDENEAQEKQHRMHKSFFTNQAVGNPAEDIGDTPQGRSKEMEEPFELESHEQKVLDDIYGILGSEQVTRRKLECAPPWVVEKAVKSEYNSNWADAYVEVKEVDVPKGANVIGSHIVYKVKVEENNRKRLKARLCPHGNHDNEKDSVRKDSATAQFDVIRLLCSIATILRFKLSCLDIKGAYLQSGPIQRDIYVRPPHELQMKRDILWKLTKMPYGITEAGRQWAKVFEQWLTEKAYFTRIHGIPQMFVQRNEDGDIRLILAKVTDDLLIAGQMQHIEVFNKNIEKRFPISKTVIDGQIKFNGAFIQQDSQGSIKLSMDGYMHEIKHMHVDKARSKSGQSRATPREVAAFRAVAGELVWLGGGALPQAAYVGSYMQQCVPYLKVDHVVQANGMLKELKDLKAEILYKCLGGDVAEATIESFSDAAFNISRAKQYGQTGLIVGLRYLVKGRTDAIYHVVDWASRKQRRVCHSSYGAEILACADADDRGYNLKMAMASLFPAKTFRHILHVDSKGLYDTITTLHEGRDYRLRQTVQRIRDSFEAGEVNIIRWIQGKANIADALTKRTPSSYRMLNRITSSGILQLPAHKSFEVNTETWV